jgi:N-ethylmaleimide reductase
METKKVYQHIFKTINLGSMELRNRLVAAPVKTNKTDPSTSAPNNLHVEYYQKRAKHAGLVISESSAISQMGLSVPNSCGIFTEEQIFGWSKVTEAVKEAEGKIFCQLWHAGRAGCGIAGRLPLGASAIPIRIEKINEDEYKTLSVPEEISEEGIIEVVNEFKQAALNADKAGFHGVEIHGASGFIIDGFLRNGANKRNDRFGGSVENRCRFPLMVIDAVVEVLGGDRVGIKISPCGRVQDMYDSDPLSLYSYFLQELSTRNIAFVEIVQPPDDREGFYPVKGEQQISDIFMALRSSFSGVLIGNQNIRFEKAEEYIENGILDMVSYGKHFIANPDLTEKLKKNIEIEKFDEKMLFSQPPQINFDEKENIRVDFK